MAWVILLAVIAIPVAEIAVFFKMAEAMGVMTTILLAVGGAMVGLTLVRAQGLRTMLDARQMLDRGEMPVDKMLDALCIAVAGALLILPGFLSDLLAILLLLPPVRAGLKAWAATRVIAANGPTSSPTVIDGDYTVIEPHDTHLGRD